MDVPTQASSTKTANEEAALQMQKNNNNAKKRPRRDQPQQSPQKKQRVEKVLASKEGNMVNPRQSRKSAVKAKTCISTRKKLGNTW